MMPAAEVKRRRACGPKVKTGCQTCKIRRVKCDEAKPSCQRCLSTGRRCDGYAHVSSRESSSSLDEDSKLSVARRVTTISGSAQERRGFQFFIEQTASELSGYFSPDFWECLILQASVAEPSLRHAVIAIGSLHESFTKNQGRLLLQGAESNEFATKQYSKALGHLRRNLAAGTEQTITALMSCLLFICFDSLRGQLTSAVVHLASGLKILRDSKGKSQAEDHMIEQHIAPLFVRSSVHSVLYFDTRRKQERLDIIKKLLEISSVPHEIPYIFEDVEEARLSLNRTADQLFRMFYMLDADKAHSAQPPEVFILHTTSMTHLEQWNKAFEALLTKRSSKFTEKQVRGAALLKIHHTICKVMADSMPDLEDTRSIAVALNCPRRLGRFDDRFERVINLSRSLIAAGEADAKAGKAPLNFSTDLGLVAPLYYACVKSSRQEQRQAAMDLLERTPRKEGMWDDASCAKLVKQFWEIEARHKELVAVDPEYETTAPMSFLVNLELKDDLDWYWNLKEPLNRIPLSK